MAPMNAFLVLTGTETLPLRMRRHCDNALAVAKWLDADVIWRDDAWWIAVCVEMAPRQSVVYVCPDGHEFSVIMADEAEVPDEWEDPKTGQLGRRVDSGEAPLP